MKNGGRGKNARELKENLENIKDKMTSTYSADGTITNSEGEKRAWTSSSPHYKGNTPTPDGSAGNIDTPTKGITETLKVMEINKNKTPQQVEEVKEKK